jgi:hypothetical protein
VNALLVDDEPGNAMQITLGKGERTPIPGWLRRACAFQAAEIFFREPV